MNKKITLVASTTMGLESIVTEELKKLGAKEIQTFNGRVEFAATLEELPKYNIWLRCADRLYIKLAKIRAVTFEDLYQGIKKINWEDYIKDKDSKFLISWVASVKSRLFSKSDIQRIAKKAMVDYLLDYYQCDRLPETGVKYQIKIQGNKDDFLILLDTSGEPLTKRGYRKGQNEAPIKETLGAALVYITKWHLREEALWDPFCGTGTILIEAAMIARNIAPGADRSFISETWKLIPEELWIKARDEAYSNEKEELPCKLIGSDIDEEVLEIAKENAVAAGVDGDIEFFSGDATRITLEESRGSIISNPPYGERLLTESEVKKLYQNLGKNLRTNSKEWSKYFITAYPKFESTFGDKATKNRKLYNGPLKCYFYQYYGQFSKK